MKGLSTLIVSYLEDLSTTFTPVAAAASAPSSLTSIKALCIAFETFRFRFPLMPERFAEFLNKVLIPNPSSASFKLYSARISRIKNCE